MTKELIPFLVNAPSLEHKSHWLLVTQSTTLDIETATVVISIPLVAGLYGFGSIEAQESAMRRINGSSAPEEIAIPVRLIQHL